MCLSCILSGKAPYSEKVPDVDEGFTQADVKDPARAEAIYKVIRARLAKASQERPFARDSAGQGFRQSGAKH